MRPTCSDFGTAIILKGVSGGGGGESRERILRTSSAEVEAEKVARAPLPLFISLSFPISPPFLSLSSSPSSSLRPPSQ